MWGVNLAVRPYPQRPAHRPLVFAHRGASAQAPENTVEAFVRASELGADGIELDAMVCGSGEVVVVHDAWLGRLTGRQICVLATPLRALQTLDFAWHRPAWGQAARIPTLHQVLEAVPRLCVNIELKDERWVDGGLAEKVAKIVAEHRADDRVVVSSFNPLELVRMRLRAPRLPLAHLFESGSGWLRASMPAPLLFAQAVHPEHVLLSEPRVRRWKRAGFAVGAWTVDDPHRARALADMGVDAVFTNDPATVLRALGER